MLENDFKLKKVGWFRIHICSRTSDQWPKLAVLIYGGFSIKNVFAFQLHERALCSIVCVVQQPETEWKLMIWLNAGEFDIQLHAIQMLQSDKIN